MISILLVDDHPMLRQGVAQLIEMEEELSVIAQAGDGTEALQKALEFDPDMILLDLNMQGMGGIETLAALRSEGVDARIVVFTVSDDHEDISAALSQGADGYLLKDSEPEDLLAAIKRAAKGEQVFSPQLTQVMAQALRSGNDHRQQTIAELTPREIEILKLIAKGMTNKQTGRELSIVEATVKVHVKNIMKKLELRSRVEVALWAVESKLI